MRFRSTDRARCDGVTNWIPADRHEVVSCRTCGGRGCGRALRILEGAAEVHEFPNRLVLGLEQLVDSEVTDFDAAEEPQIRAVEVGELGGDAFDALDAVDHSVG
jgi:hypothetical protein